MTTAWMFPGQGSQTPGMARKLVAEFAIAAQILDEASQRCGHDLNRVRAVGPQSQLVDPEIAEPLLAATQIAYATILLDQNVRPDVVAGYSAGEVAAYYAAGVLSREDALAAAVIRGRVLKRFVSDETAMVAVAKLSTSEVSDHAAAFPQVEVAAWNAPHHVTLVGNRDAINVLAKDLTRAGAMVSDVAVAGPWHSRTIATASHEIHKEFQSLVFRRPSVPLFASASGLQEWEPSVLASRLAEQVSCAVRWDSIVKNWENLNVRYALEVGAGRVLMGLLRHNWPQYETYKVECVESASGSIAVLRRLLTATSLGS